MFSKIFSASSTVRFKTSAMFLPLYLTSRVSLLNLLPRQTSQVTKTGGKKCISISFEPAPSQASQRPPGRLNENREMPNPFSFASGSEANKSRIGENTPVYVAGLERGVRPI